MEPSAHCARKLLIDLKGVQYVSDIHKLIWLFPIAFILHDLEEIRQAEPWLKKNSGLIMSRIPDKAPAFLARQMSIILSKTTTQFAFPIFLIFVLTCISALLAAEFQSYPMFLVASSLFFLHGFMHVGQAIFLRRYIPALITSVLITIPYGIVLFWKLLEAGIADLFRAGDLFWWRLSWRSPLIVGMHYCGRGGLSA